MLRCRWFDWLWKCWDFHSTMCPPFWMCRKFPIFIVFFFRFLFNPIPQLLQWHRLQCVNQRSLLDVLKYMDLIEKKPKEEYTASYLFPRWSCLHMYTASYLVQRLELGKLGKFSAHSKWWTHGAVVISTLARSIKPSTAKHLFLDRGSTPPLKNLIWEETEKWSSCQEISAKSFRIWKNSGLWGVD